MKIHVTNLYFVDRSIDFGFRIKQAGREIGVNEEAMCKLLCTSFFCNISIFLHVIKLKRSTFFEKIIFLTIAIQHYEKLGESSF